MIWRSVVLACLAIIAFAAPLRAHEVRPAYLALDETAENEFDVVWKLPAVPGGVLALSPVLPESCAPLTTAQPESAPGAIITRWRVRCDGGLSGGLGAEGLERTVTTAFVSVRWRSGQSLEGVVTGAQPSLSLERDAPPPTLAYFVIGVQHILGGFDHLAFVAGLVLTVAGWRRLLLTLTAFTLAHSLTLGAAALGFVGLASRPVEATIAFSIAVVAREAWLGRDAQSAIMRTAPWAVAFAFGLLHGFGFAGALSEIGLPQDARVPALLLFNVGVEAGQILVVALLAPLLLAVRRLAAPRAFMVERTASLALGSLAMMWLIERLAA